jgi:hypothetical protein
MNAKEHCLEYRKKNTKIFTSTFNELGQTINILSRIAHHNLPAANAITDMGSIVSPSSISPCPLPCRVEISSIDRTIGLSKSQRPP